MGGGGPCPFGRQPGAGNDPDRRGGGGQSGPLADDANLAKWRFDDRGYADVPVGPPLTQLQIAQQLPTLGLTLGDQRPHVRGKIREYVSL